MSKNYHIAVLPGDGIGPEVMTQPICDAYHHQPLRCRRRSH